MNEAVIKKFYISFQQKDWQGMQSCYHDEVVFSDPVFTHLKGASAKAMWHMLTTSAKDLTITYYNTKANGSNGSCEWEAKYTFSKTGAPVHNRIRAEFEFKDGKIIRHTDTFNLTAWAGMALGFIGKLMGWTPWIQSKIRKSAAISLEKFMANHPLYKDFNR